MVNVAIAGGTSPTLGKSLVEAILATKKHNVIILSRRSTSSSASSSTPSSSSRRYGAPIIYVNYNSPKELSDTLRSHAIHTLISVLKIPDPVAILAIHKDLLDAAQSAKVTRFILSDWSLAAPSHSRVDLLSHKTALHELGQTHMSSASCSSPSSAVGKHIVECCTIQNGEFLEYFAQGCGRRNVQAGLDDDLMLEFIDVRNGRVVVPLNDRREPAVVTLTSLVDIGRFVAAALNLPAGELMGQIGIAGCDISYTHIVEMLRALKPSSVVGDVVPTFVTKEECDAIAEDRGKVFKEKMSKNGEVDVNALKGRMVAQIVSCQCDGAEGGGVVMGRRLNDLCPDVKPVDVEDFLRRAWVSF